MKLVIKQAGFLTFTGNLATVDFVNGVSVNDLSHEQAMHVAAVMHVDWQNDPVTIVWAATTPVALNAEVIGGLNIWKVTTAGNTGATQPVWPSNPTTGTTAADGTAVWTWLEAIDAGADDVTNPLVQQITDLK